MKAKKWFYARGQSASARGLNISDAMIDCRMKKAPDWAKDAFKTGWLDVYLAKHKNNVHIGML